MKTKHLLFLITLFFTAQLIHAQGSKMWGLAQSGGAYNMGTLFNMNPDGSDFTVEHHFSAPEGWSPRGNLLQASDGNLYGTCYEGGDYYSCTIFRFNPQSGDYTDVYDFNIIDGDYPTSGVVEKNGILYGNSSTGGSSGGGVIYTYSISSGIYTDVYNLSTGRNPYSEPLFAADGKLYGVNYNGGMNQKGTIYSYDTDNGAYTDVHHFSATTGSFPYGGMIEATDGRLYGMTNYGGSNAQGVLYSFDPSTDTYSVLHEFDEINGGHPKSTLTQGYDGKLYGSTTYGGANDYGVLFVYDISNNIFTKLFDFDATTGGAPLGNLSQSENILCGTTSLGGANNIGTVFNYNTASGIFTNLLDFESSMGAYPSGGFIKLSVGTATVNPSHEQLNVYPNPVSQYAFCSVPFVKEGNARINITDVTGKQILSQEAEIKNSQLTLNVAYLTSGVYFFEIISSSGKKITRIVKE